MAAITSSRPRLSPLSNHGAAAALEVPPPEPVTSAGARPAEPVFPGDFDTSEHSAFTLLGFEEAYLRANLDVLTVREREVVLAICAGGTNDAVSARLCIALPTLRTHLMRLNQKLGTTSKGDVVRFAASILIDAYRRGILHCPAATPVVGDMNGVC